MQKDELIQMHTLLCQIKNHFEEAGVPSSMFERYHRLGISPVHVHRSKTDHKRAIFVLGQELAAFISTGEFSGPARMSHRMETILTKISR
ncbi:MAG: UPF0058 family protein [Thermoplasmatota archaeon]